MASKKRKGAASWKVIFWTDAVNGLPTRYVYGQRTADRAWRLYWLARAKGHISAVQLWHGQKQIL